MVLDTAKPAYLHASKLDKENMNLAKKLNQ